MKKIKECICPKCGLNFSRRGGLVQSGYLIYNSRSSIEFVPSYFDINRQETYCENCNYNLSKEFMKDLNVLYPEVAKQDKFIYDYRHDVCGALTMDGVYTAIELKLVPVSMYYSYMGNYERAFVESQFYSDNILIAMIANESESVYCNSCHEEVINIKIKKNAIQCMKENIISYL